MNKYLLRRKNKLKNPKLNHSKFTNKEENFRHLKICITIEHHLISKGFLPKREWYIVLDDEDHIVGFPRAKITEAEKLRREKYRNPDLLWWDDGLWIIEIDGYVHHMKSANTEKRDNIYKNNNCKYIVIQTYEMGEYKIIDKPIEKILKEVDEKILELKNEL